MDSRNSEALNWLEPVQGLWRSFKLYLKDRVMEFYRNAGQQARHD
jgi:hypothetical protein